jgi:hypothetical protein
MAKFSKKEKTVPTAVNEMGEAAYELSPKEELVATVLATFLQNKYYETENEVVSRILEAAAKTDEKFVAQLALYARRDGNMRSVSHLLAGYLPKRLSGKKYARRFYRKICVRPDDLSEIYGYYQSTEHEGKMPNAMRVGFKSYLESMDAYLIDKYKMKRRRITLKDLANLCRIKPTQENEEAWRRLFNGESLAGLYESKVLDKELTKAGEKGQTREEKEKLKGEVFREQLENVRGMPIFALLRNLRNILQYAPDKTEEACRQLVIKDKILKSRLLPFRFATAYAEVEKYQLPEKSGEVVFEKDLADQADIEKLAEYKEQMLAGLETALKYSVENIPEFEGNTAVLIDHSGSVRGDAGGESFVSAFSKTRTAMIGNLFGSMAAFSQENVYIGLFGDKLISVPIDRSKGVLEFNQESFALGGKCGPATENGLYIFLNDCIENKTRVDNLVIFSDMVIGDGGRGGWDATSRAGLGTFQTLFNRFRSLNPNCLTVSININQTSGKTVFDRSLNVMQIAGWSERIFDQITGQSRGYDEIIKAIEKTDL